MLLKLSYGKLKTVGSKIIGFVTPTRPSKTRPSASDDDSGTCAPPKNKIFFLSQFNFIEVNIVHNHENTERVLRKIIIIYRY